MTSLKNYQMRVYVENLGKYTQGESQGAWITLPVPADQLDSFLSQRIGLDEGRGEYAIHDREGDEGLLAYVPEPRESDRLDDLNLMCRAFEEREDDDPKVYEKVQTVRDWYDGETRGPLQYANLALNSDRIPYHEYDAPSYAYSRFERYAFTRLEADAVPQAVKDMFDANYGYLVNMDKLGQDLVADGQVSLGATGYLDDMDWPVDIDDRYSREEIADEVAWLDEYDDEHQGASVDPADPLALGGPADAAAPTR